ncbi:MAG: hypothetical protein K0Q94_3213 [Paenibacillus sp.]|jgi:putative aldouronate transport system substrate-binding protein|nr:hypothetical protein [Paenibacillus sp.]
MRRGFWAAGLTALLAAAGLAATAVLLGQPGYRLHGSAGPGEASDRLTVSIMQPMYDRKPQRSEVWDLLENKFNIRYEPVSIPAASYSTKLMMAVSSGKPPDIVLWTSFMSELINFIESGLFHDLTPYIGNSANLKTAIPQRIWNRVKLNGSYYGIPRPRAEVDQAVMIRKDWLEALRLPVPETIDDYYNTAVKFGQSDPDGNGRKDTYGFAAGEGLNFLHNLLPAFGAGNSWILRADGSLEASKVSPERESGLLWLRKLYAERGIDQSFSSLQQSQVWDRFTSGKTGIIVAPIADYERFRARLASANPKAELLMLGPPVGPEGISGFGERPGYYGLFLIPKRVPEEKVKRIVELLDWQSGEEANRIRKFGLEGVHHTVKEDGTLQINRESLQVEDLGSLLLMNPYDPYYYVSTSAPEYVQEKQRAMLDLVRDKGIPNPAEGFMPNTGLSVASIYTKKIQRFETDFVKGNVPVQDFAWFRREWLDRGGKEATQEVNEWYRTYRSNGEQGRRDGG